MSTTIIDMPKVTQMLDAGWHVILFKNGMGTYEAQASHRDEKMLASLALKLRAGHESVPGQNLSYEREFDWNDDDCTERSYLKTDDFTPEQALTRLAYKVHGEIL